MMDGGNSETHRGSSGGLADIGAMLRDRRIELKQDIDTVARQTRIKVAYLKAIEEGRRRDLPGTAYTIGFVRTYADYLGFDGNRLVTDFHAQLAGDRKRAADAQAAAEASRRRLSPVGIVAGLLTLAMIAFFAWQYWSDRVREADEADLAETEEPVEEAVEAADAPNDAEVEPATVNPVVTPEVVSPPPADAAATAPDQAAAAQVEDQVPPEAEAPPVAETPPAEEVPPVAETAQTPGEEPDPGQETAAVESGQAGAGQAGTIVLRARLESWVQITNEKGESIFSRVLRAGETYTVPNEPGLVMTTGNAGGIEIVLDDKKLRSLGSVGLVRRNIPLDPQKLRDGSAFEPAAAPQDG